MSIPNGTPGPRIPARIFLTLALGLLTVISLTGPTLGNAIAAQMPMIHDETNGEVAPTSIDLNHPGTSSTLPQLLRAAKPAAPRLDAGCVVSALPNDNSTSVNGRAPSTRFSYIRSVYLITAAELAGFSTGALTQIGWNYQTAPGTGGSAPLKIYLQNTSDVAMSKSTNWATAISTMTTVHNAVTALPGTIGPFDITFAGGSPFTYTGGGLYVAFDWGQYTGTLSTTAVIWCNSLGLPGGLLGAQSNVSPPVTTLASNFRPETRLASTIANDVSVDYIYALGKLPLGIIDYQFMGAVVTNRGGNTQTNVSVTLDITGAETFTDTQIVPELPPCGGQAVVTFNGWLPTVLGSNTVTVSVPSDEVASNNSRAQPLDVTLSDYTYKVPASTPTGGVGVDGNTATLIGRLPVITTVNVLTIELEFAIASGVTYKAVILDEFGDPLYVDAVDRTVTGVGPVSITLDTPVAVGPGDVYVGIQQTGAANVGLSFDEEVPVRSLSFFGEIPIGTGFFDFSPGADFKLNVGATYDRCDPTQFAANSGPTCQGQNLDLFAAADYGATYSWTGPNGFTSDLQNPSIPNATAAASGTYTVVVNNCPPGATTEVVVDPPYTIVSSAGSDGSIAPDGNIAVNCFEDQGFTITPDFGFLIADVLVDGNSVGPVSSYTFPDVQTNHTISASFVTALDAQVRTPERFELKLASGNPSHGRCAMFLMMAKPASVHAEVLDVLGRTVAVLVNHQAYDAGVHPLNWSGRDMSGVASPAGMYFMRVRAGSDEAVLRSVPAR